MLLAHLLEERMWALNRLGKVAIVGSWYGQEAAQVGAARALTIGLDFVLPYYRDVPLTLAVGMSVRDQMLSLYAKRDDPSSGGRQFPGHFSHPRLRIYTASSPVGTQIPHAVGLALASRINRDGAVTFTAFGEGATSTGDWHEGLNFAGIHRLPVVFFCENNGYAISVPQSKQMAVQDVASRASGYGMPGVVVDGMDLEAVYATVKRAVDQARAGEGPTLVEAKVYRISAHTSEDDHLRYRSREEVEYWRARNPIDRLAATLRERQLLDAERIETLRARALEEIDRAIEEAEQAPLPDAADLERYVYADVESAR
jgi:2-oxoisovalerate dehydrogenase E1 component alpha subunit